MTRLWHVISFLAGAYLAAIVCLRDPATHGLLRELARHH